MKRALTLLPLLLAGLAAAQNAYVIPPNTKVAPQSGRYSAPPTVSRTPPQAQIQHDRNRGIPNGLRPYVFLESYDLSETVDGGKPFVDESGQLYGLGLNWNVPASDRIRLDLLFEGFWGSVDYDGALQDAFGGRDTPLQDKTDYAGIRTEGLLVFPMGDENGFRIEPFVGVGLRAFSRDIASGHDSGQIEDWSSIYGLIGSGFVGHLGGGSHWFVKGAVGIPFSNTNSISSNSAEDLDPGKEPFIFGELGYRHGRFELAGFYKFYDYSASDTIRIGDFRVSQPATEISLLGLRLGYQF